MGVSSYWPGVGAKRKIRYIMEQMRKKLYEPMRCFVDGGTMHLFANAVSTT